MNNISDIDIKNKQVLIRVDYNVPIEEGISVNPMFPKYNFSILS